MKVNPAVKLSPAMADLLTTLRNTEASVLARKPDASEFERGYRTGPSTGNTMQALKRRGLARCVYAGPRSFMYSWLLTDEGREVAG